MTAEVTVFAMTNSRSPRSLRTSRSALRAAGLGLLLSLFGCGGGGGSTSTAPLTPSVTLTATPSQVAPGGTATLTWSSRNVSSVTASNFNATAVSGTVQVGPLNATTDYTITCGGPNGSATAHATVVVKSGTVTSIPTGVLLYSLQNTDGTSTLLYQPVSGGSPVTVGTYPAGVSVLATNAAGTRLVVAEPASGSSGKQVVAVTDLDGVSNAVSDTSFTATQVNDACLSSNGDLVVAHSNGLYYISPSGVGLTGFGGIPSQSVTVSPDGLTSVYCLTNRIEQGSVPSNSSTTTIISGKALSWVRYSVDGSKLTFADSNAIYTANRDGSNKQQIESVGTFPTFDNTGTRILYSRVGDGIYIHDLNANTDTKLASISGTWNGRIFWH